MKKDLIAFYRVQRNLFGICPHSGEIFRLSDCKVFLKTKPRRDWKDRIDRESGRLDRLEESHAEQQEKWREAGRKKGRRQALKLIERIDPVFTPRNLNADDAKVLFHPVDYIVFDGMKKNSLRSLLLLDHAATSDDRKKLQQSLGKVISKGHYEWRTFSIGEDGNVHESE